MNKWSVEMEYRLSDNTWNEDEYKAIDRVIKRKLQNMRKNLLRKWEANMQ